MAIYELNETAVGELDHRRIPVLNGDIYCSPFCGGKCKKADYDEALVASNKIAAQLGTGWVPEVFENLGWYWKVTKGNLEVRKSDAGYNATMQFDQDQNYYFSADDIDPRKAVQNVRKQLSDIIRKLERQYASSDLDPIAISSY